MSRHSLKNLPLSQIVKGIVLLVGVVILGYFLLHTGNPLSRRAIGQMRRYILSFGIWAPVTVVVLIIISTLIPPLPLPVPLIEVAAGLAFGFGPGLILIWISQLLSSVLAFGVSRKLGKRILPFFLKTRLFTRYSEFIKQKGFWGILLLRLSMLNPFDIVSYLSGLTQISLSSFIVAIAFGTLPEVVLFAFIGSRIRTLGSALRYLNVVIIAIIVLAVVSTLIYLQIKKYKAKKLLTIISGQT